MNLEELKKEIEDFKNDCITYRKELRRAREPMLPGFVHNTHLAQELRSKLNIKLGALQHYITTIGKNPRSSHGQLAYSTAFAYEQGMIIRVGPALDAVIQDLDYITGAISSLSDKEFNKIFNSDDSQLEDVIDEPLSNDKDMTLKKILLICQNFHKLAINIQEREREREPLIINDEYDVQYFLNGLLNMIFENVSKEEWTPSRSGSSSRMDFILKPEKTVIETKMTREGLNIKKLKEELTLDINDYAEHYDCATLVFFIYDPISIIKNQQGFTNGIAGKYTIRGKEVAVRVIISPKLEPTDFNGIT